MSYDKSPGMTPSPQDVATAIYQVACSRGLTSPSDIEEQAGTLLAGFALENPEHPVARFFESASDLEVEAFFRALSQRVSASRTASSALTHSLRASAVTQVDLRVWLN
jgi:hypothetical protein